MCGVAGVIPKKHAFNDADSTTLMSMVEKLRHRGPDAKKTWNDSRVGLGHTRLKIIDLSDRANQPFTDGEDVLSFNGEIFNFQKLRDELLPHFSFSTTSDTEVLFRGLQWWGEDIFSKLNGQFAFIFYSKKKEQVLIARDPTGICPLYVSETQSHILISSEIKPILPFIKSGIQPSSVIDYFTYRYNIQNGLTLFRNIERFHPAHYSVIRLTDFERRTKRYWRLKWQESEGDSNKFQNLLDREIKNQSIADVSVGLYLSGGIDSGAILKGFHEVQSDIRAYTLGMTHDDLDFERVELLKNKTPFISNRVHFSLAMEDELEDAVESLEEPFGDLIILANYTLARRASKDVKVVLSGEGGDEAFGGYDHQRFFSKALSLQGPLGDLGRKVFRLFPPSLLNLMKSYPGRFGDEEKSKILNVFESIKRPDISYLRLISLFQEDELRLLLNDSFVKNHGVAADRTPISEIFELDRDPKKAMLRAEIEQLTLIINLLKQDRFSMRFSLEGRVPLVSKNILDFVGTLNIDKLFLESNKKLLMDYSSYPKVKKKAFSVFHTDFYVNRLRELLKTYATVERVSATQILSPHGVISILSGLENGGMLAVKKAMNLLIFLVWFKKFERSL